MKQIAQRMRDGQMQVLDVPLPELGDSEILVRSEASLVSAGTERAKVTVARDSLIGKARRRPDQARKVIEKARRDGVRETVQAVRRQLDELAPLGYCVAGRVERVGALVRDLNPGDRVACGGEGAGHAEMIVVPTNLGVRVPDEVSIEAAAFTTLGAIALHGFRQAELRLGESVAVVGMGLVGQLSARIARAAGCEVLGIDLDSWRLDVGEAAGALNRSRKRAEVTDDLHGMWDAVLVTAAAPSSNDPVSLATELARDRGRIVVVGDVKLELDRSRLYERELELRLARSYGPGRYDREYEARGLDYPLPYVRWTERRNMAAFLTMLARQEVSVDDLITHTFSIDHAEDAFDLLASPEERSLALIISYASESDKAPVAPVSARNRGRFIPGPSVGIIGAGSFAQRQLIPLSLKFGLTLDLVATSSGLSAVSTAQRFKFDRGACTVPELIADDTLAGVIIATRHDRHSDLVLEALRAGKAVFVEKPLCLNESELAEIEAELHLSDAPPLMVGFNRRWAPLKIALKNFVGAQGPSQVLIRVSAGPLADDHWLNDPVEGGGRLVGEGCHFFDLLVDIVGAPPVAVSAQAHARANEPVQCVQDFTASVRFADGSLGTLVYSSMGSSRLGKELLEVHRGTRSARLDDFTSLTMWGNGRSVSERSRNRDKGHSAQIERFAQIVRGELEPPNPASYITSMRVTFAALRALQSGREQLLEHDISKEES